MSKMKYRCVEEKKRGTPYGPYLSIIIDEIKRKVARIYVVFNFKITKPFRK